MNDDQRDDKAADFGKGLRDFAEAHGICMMDIDDEWEFPANELENVDADPQESMMRECRFNGSCWGLACVVNGRYRLCDDFTSKTLHEVRLKAEMVSGMSADELWERGFRFVSLNGNYRVNRMESEHGSRKTR